MFKRSNLEYKPPVTKQEEENDLVLDYTGDAKDVENFHKAKKAFMRIVQFKYPSIPLEYIFDENALRPDYTDQLEEAKQIAPVPDAGESCPRRYRMRAVMDKAQALQDAEEGAYGLIKTKLTESLRREVQSMPEFREIEAKRNPKALWDLISIIILLGSQTGVYSEFTSLKAYERFNNITQKPNETVEEFFTRFKREYGYAQRRNASYFLHNVVRDMIREVDFSGFTNLSLTSATNTTSARATRSTNAASSSNSSSNDGGDSSSTSAGGSVTVGPTAAEPVVREWFRRYTADLLSDMAAMDEARVVAKFLLSLDRVRYQGLRDELANEYGRGNNNTYPVTMMDALKLARNYNVNGQRVGRMVLATSGKNNNSTGKPRATAAGGADTASATGDATGGTNVAMYASENNKHSDNNNKKNSNNNKNNNTNKSSDSSSVNSDGTKRDYSKVKCFNCNAKGHISKNCPEKSNNKRVVAMTIDNGGGVSFAYPMITLDQNVAESSPGCVMHSSISDALADPWTIMLDSGSTSNVVGNKLLVDDIEELDEPHVIHGIGGTITISTVGTMTGVGRVYVTDHTPGNILSLADVLDRSKRMELLKDGIRVEFHDGKTVHFTRVGKLFFADAREWFTDKWVKSCENGVMMVATVAGKRAGYTQAELREADDARKLIARLGYPSERRVLDNLHWFNNSNVTRRGIRIFYDIFGKPEAMLMGKTVRKPSKKVRFDDPDSAVQRFDVDPDIILCIDLFYVNGVAFLLTVSRSLSLIAVKYLKDKSLATIKSSLVAIMDSYSTRNFKISRVIGDGESSFLPLDVFLSSRQVEFNCTCPAEHTAEAERSVRSLKEICRTIFHSLPYDLCSSLIVYLVYYSVIVRNMLTPKNSSFAVPPRVLFNGKRTDCKLELQLEFGEYCHIHEDDTYPRNSMDKRTTGAIALIPVGNVQGAYLFLNLSTRRIVRRRSWTALPMPDHVIQMLNDMAKSEKGNANKQLTIRFAGQDLPDGESDNPDEDTAWRPLQRDALTGVHETVPVTISDAVPGPEDQTVAIEDYHDASEVANDAAMMPGVDDGIDLDDVLPTGNVIDPDLEIREGIGTDDTADTAYIDADGIQPVAEDLDATPDDSETVKRLAESVVPMMVELVRDQMQRGGKRYNLRSKLTTYKTLYDSDDVFKFTGHMSVKTSLKKFGNAAKESLQKELHQLAKEKRAFHFVRQEDIPTQHQGRVIRCHIIVEVKRDGRIKSRLVANETKAPSRYLEVETSSPTALTENVFMSIAIDIYEDRYVATVDIEGAYLHADAQSDIYMVIDGEIADLFEEMYPEEVRPLRSGKRGVLYAKLDKALYGCIDSAKLFYDLLSSFLIKNGYTRSSYDLCIFFKYYDDGQCTVVVHVDDLKISCKYSRGVEDTITIIEAFFKKIKIHRGKVFDYLGMVIDYSNKGYAVVQLYKLVDEMLEDMDSYVKPNVTAKTPATLDLFNVNPDAKPLAEDKRVVMHSVGAKGLYLAKRTRPDILLAVGFIMSRVHAATEEDWSKFCRIIYYLRGTRELTLKLGVFPSGIKLVNYVDASFAVHPDMRSHTGAMMSLGRGSIVCFAQKHTMVAKSSTEAELIGQVDIMSRGLGMRYTLLEMGYNIGMLILFQDNKSTIHMLTNEKGASSRTRHIHIRYFFVRDRVRAGEVEVRYMPTENMIADFFTKPLVGKRFQQLRDYILGETPLEDDLVDSSHRRGVLDHAQTLMVIPER